MCQCYFFRFGTTPNSRLFVTRKSSCNRFQRCHVTGAGRDEKQKKRTNRTTTILITLYSCSKIVCKNVFILTICMQKYTMLIQEYNFIYIICENVLTIGPDATYDRCTILCRKYSYYVRHVNVMHTIQSCYYILIMHDVHKLLYARVLYSSK